jgi:hypothetical protein
LIRLEFEGGTVPNRSTTERGFITYDEMRDDHGQDFVVRESSSAAEPKVWLFITNADDCQGGHLHLNEEQAKNLRDALTAFLDEIPERWARQ